VWLNNLDNLKTASQLKSPLANNQEEKSALSAKRESAKEL
jgi:hypothetical protein